MPFVNLHIKTASEHAESIAEYLAELGAVSVAMQDGADQDVFALAPGDNPLWDDVLITGLFSEEDELSAILDTIKTELKLSKLEHKIEPVEEQDWVRITQSHFQPQCYANTLWVCPSWDEQPHEGLVVRIDPGLAFGTGNHATTSLCLQWLATHPPQNQPVIDYGCGSGILSLAALALGATHVEAIDHDPQALIATENNANLNAFATSQNLTIAVPEKASLDVVPYVIANILANPLIQLAPTLTSCTASENGVLILSGILTKEHDAVLKAYEPDFALIEMCTKEEWCLLALQRRT